MKKVLKYSFAIFSLLMVIGAIYSEDPTARPLAISFGWIAILLLPCFEYICKLCNSKFSIGRKVVLGFGLFFIPAIFASQDGSIEKSSAIQSAIIFSLIFFTFMFITNKNKYSDIDKKVFAEKEKSNNIFDKLLNYLNNKRNNRVFKEIQKENEVIEKFKDLDVFTTNAIASMISETKRKYNAPFNDELPEIDISKVIMDFCKDTNDFEYVYQFDNLFTQSYYKKKINKCFSTTKKYIVKKIVKELSSNNGNKSNYVYSQFIDIITKNMKLYESVKFYSNVSVQKEELIQYKDYGLSNLSINYRDAYIYMVDLLLTSTCISKLIFIEQKVKGIDKNSEFYIMLSNMAKEISDISLIINKTRPIYEEFYKSELGFLNDELLYSMAITIMVNRLNNFELTNKDSKIINLSDEKINDFDSYDTMMNKWIYDIAKDNRYLEVSRYIVYKTVNTVMPGNFKLLIDALGQTENYKNLYDCLVIHNNKQSDRERYLSGDFTKEKQEMSEQYSLNNIATGAQFELYLVDLFKKLGYKAKHTGKAGDQGADLILKKDDYVYVVQAKYYTDKLSNTPVQEIVGAMKYYNANQGVVVTNSTFTNGAVELAKANNVILIDGKGLKKLVDYIFDRDEDEDVLQKF